MYTSCHAHGHSFARTGRSHPSAPCQGVVAFRHSGRTVGPAERKFQHAETAPRYLQERLHSIQGLYTDGRVVYTM